MTPGGSMQKIKIYFNYTKFKMFLNQSWTLLGDIFNMYLNHRT